MATSANLLVKINGDSKSFDKAMGRGRMSAKRFAKDAAKSIARVSKMLAGTLVVSATAAGFAISKISKEVDKLAKTSSLLGGTVKGLQEIQFVTGLAGVGAKTTNMALQRMVRRIAEASKGTGEAVGALKELRLDAERLNRLTLEQKFFAVARAMSSVRNEGDKVRLAMKLFDSEGAKLANAFGRNVGSLREEFKELGGGIDEASAKAVESFNDAQTKMGVISTNLGQTITANIAPAFTLIITNITETIKSMGGLKSVAAEIAKAIVQSSIVMIKAFEGVRSIISTIQQTVNAISLNRLNNDIDTAKANIAKREKLGLTQGGGSGLSKYDSISEEKGKLAGLQRQRTDLLQREESLSSSNSSRLITQLQKMSNNLARKADERLQVNVKVDAAPGLKGTATIEFSGDASSRKVIDTRTNEAARSVAE